MKIREALGFPLKTLAQTTGTYGFYQAIHAIKDNEENPFEYAPDFVIKGGKAVLGFTATSGLVASAFSRVTFQKFVKQDYSNAIEDLGLIGAGIIDAGGWIATFMVTMPFLEHSYGVSGLAAFLLSRAAINLTSHKFADMLGKVIKKERQA